MCVSFSSLKITAYVGLLHSVFHLRLHFALFYQYGHNFLNIDLHIGTVALLTSLLAIENIYYNTMSKQNKNKQMSMHTTSYKHKHSMAQ